eukprot:SAG11_NODE_2014_length_3922_cov_1.929898_1_plen_119_part_00
MVSLDTLPPPTEKKTKKKLMATATSNWRCRERVDHAAYAQGHPIVRVLPYYRAVSRSALCPARLSTAEPHCASRSGLVVAVAAGGRRAAVGVELGLLMDRVEPCDLRRTAPTAVGGGR